jgi:hypothetical protein
MVMANPFGSFAVEQYPPQRLFGTEDSPVQFVVLPDGYTKNELGKFKEDANRLVLGTLLQNRAIAKYRNKIGIVVFDVPSSTSGFANPFFGSVLEGGTQTTFGKRSIPIQFIKTNYPKAYVGIVLVNANANGGQSVPNATPSIMVVSVDSPRSPFLILHEFGHAFAHRKHEYTQERGVLNVFARPTGNGSEVCVMGAGKAERKQGKRSEGPPSMNYCNECEEAIENVFKSVINRDSPPQRQ